ncbi:MAG: cytochrome c oxidase subunit II [Burkholderiaceae bacterium]|nr:cytochrome c oxidase subunit II [Burkholderiaceae bacterium]
MLRRWSWLTGLVCLACLCSAPVALAAAEIRDPARAWDALWREYLVDVGIIFVIFAGLGAWFMLRYRRRSPDEQGSPPQLSRLAAVGWAVIPAFAFMADDFYLAAKTWQVWNIYRDVPADRLEIKLDAAMWRWDFTYPNGVQATNDLRVPAGKPIMMRMTSTDVVHSFYLPDFRVKEDSMPGRVTYLWFYPRTPGEHITTCAEFCGMMHSKMIGKVIVMKPDDFAAWYGDEAKKLADAKQKTGG